MELTILTNDPSFRAWGYAVLDTEGQIFEAGCIKTEPEQKKRRIRKGDDTVRRISEINKTLLEIIRRYNVNYILSELPHGSQNASAAAMIGGVTAVMQTLSDSLGIAIEWYSEADAKKCLSGQRSMTKQATIDCINEYYRVPWTGKKYKDEAIADALAIYDVAKNYSNIFKL